MSRKIINHPDCVINEMMQGFVEAFGKYYEKHPQVNAVLSRYRRRDKVALVVGGGSGHEPMFSGFVGEGLADGAACGNIFASPDPNTVYQTAKAVSQGKGVLFVYGCYAGDNLNFDMGEEFLKEAGIETRHVRVWDDVASAPRDRIEDRRGIAGDVFVIKIAGGACDAGMNLEEAARITEKARDNTYSIGIATAPAQLPGVEKPIFELGEGEIEYGMGIHGERGILRTSWQEADILTEKMYVQLMENAEIKAGEEVCVLINGLGSTTLLELSIIYRKVKELLDKDQIIVYDSDLNSYCTSQEMGGFSISFLRLDNELKKYYDMPCRSPFYTRGVWKEEKERLVSTLKESERYTVSGGEKELLREKTSEIGGTDKHTVKSEENITGKLSARAARNMLLYVAEKMIGEKDYLTEVDNAVGDGDHGIGMAGGMEKVKQVLSAISEPRSVCEVFDKAGKAMLFSMGGASGVIFGSMFYGGVSEMKEKEALSAADFAKAFRKSLQTIKERGKAEVGDKTMVDALEPAAEAMEKAADRGFIEMLKAAEAAAKQGMENTKHYRAKFGRAKSLMDRAIGYQDAGATSVWLILQGMREFVEG
ncbi:MAG: dihydroxyacetone kinase subunit DhaL [Eubacteriales bacterium]|nr:dihydroxyacetone kinase subunit DhaL [Eubacteriales bacterium]